MGWCLRTATIRRTEFNREPREIREMENPNPVRVFGVFRGSFRFNSFKVIFILPIHPAQPLRVNAGLHAATALRLAEARLGLRWQAQRDTAFARTRRGDCSIIIARSKAPSPLSLCRRTP